MQGRRQFVVVAMTLACALWAQAPAQPAQEGRPLLLDTLLLRGIQDVYEKDWSKISYADRQYLLELKKQLLERPRVNY